MFTLINFDNFGQFIRIYFLITKIRQNDQQDETGPEQENQMGMDDADFNPIRFLAKIPLPENRDCLERIFMCLGSDIESLLKLGQCNKLFKEVATTVLQRKYGWHTIVLCCFYDCRNKLHQNRRNVLCLSGMKKILPFVRVFGAAISKLEVHYYSHLDYTNLSKCQRSAVDLRMWRLNEYINEYCASTLVGLEWHFKPQLSNDMAKPFQQLEWLREHWSYLNEQLPKFVEWFPNLQRFDVLVRDLNERCSAVTLPHLKRLVITFIDMDDAAANLAQLSKARAFLKANPQLQSVIINKAESAIEYATIKDIFDMVSGNAQLTKVEISVLRRSSGTNIDAVQVNQFAKEHPNLVELAIYDEHEFKADVALAVMCELNALKKFRFNIKEDFERNKFMRHLGNDWHHTSLSFDNFHRLNLNRKN